MKIIALALTICLASVMPVSGAVDRSDNSPIDGLARIAEREEPDWRYVVAVCTCGPQIPEQTKVELGSWRIFDGIEKLDGLQKTVDMVNVDIYTGASSEKIADWMNGYSTGKLWTNCQVMRYQLADEAYMVDCPYEPQNRVQINLGIDFRKDNHVVSIRGSSWSNAERFAALALRALSTNP